MWGGLVGLVAGVYATMDQASGTDHCAKATFRQDDKGNIHVLDVELIEPPNATIEMRLVPGSNPPRYESV